MKALLFGSGAAILAAGAVAFALSQDGRSADAPEPIVSRQEAPAPAAELVAADPIPEPAAPEPEVALPPGYTVDEDGHVWEPLSYYKPQHKNNGDGTVTTRKLARIYEADGTMREIPIKIVASVSQKRMPVKQRGLPPTVQKQLDAESAAAEGPDAAEGGD